jgi:hypothetical protein
MYRKNQINEELKEDYQVNIAECIGRTQINDGLKEEYQVVIV